MLGPLVSTFDTYLDVRFRSPVWTLHWSEWGTARFMGKGRERHVKAEVGAAGGGWCTTRQGLSLR